MSDRFNLQFPCAHSQDHSLPAITAVFRRQPEDFYVDEDLGFEPSGEGEHVFIHLQKRGDNTAWVARQIARLADVQPMDVGYGGLKDRRAVTRQWFSVYLPGKTGEVIPEPDWQQLNSETVEILQVSRHSKKLRRGQHRANRFVIRLRELSAELDEAQLERILSNGVPNYFGEQRFGHDGNNLIDADALLSGERRIKNRQKRGLILSAARSYLFNRVLSERVELGNWQATLAGEVELDGMPAGPLWGRGRLQTQEEVLALESSVLEPWACWCDALEHVGLSQERRSLVLKPVDPQWQWLTDDQGNKDLELAFSLPPGTYATAVLREIAQLKQLPDPEDMV